MDRLERAMNALTDRDWAWHPFLFLRPEQHELMDSRRVARLALFFGPITAALAILGFLAVGFHPQPLNLAEVVVSAMALFFASYRLTFAVAWNRRAERLRSGASEAAATPPATPASPAPPAA